ncbi:hypothetical protein EYF80_009051 [Liparis tanakae]|uniref:Uncharacterized protein n=1 Tax=Liparis tanakae TaxID=230148 RepID=A0A4Z2IRQ6_9TELE|nr:hypothetical protein EYF80_009051 [Liparis tanakae]
MTESYDVEANLIAFKGTAERDGWKDEAFLLPSLRGQFSIAQMEDPNLLHARMQQCHIMRAWVEDGALGDQAQDEGALGDRAQDVGALGSARTGARGAEARRDGPEEILVGYTKTKYPMRNL